MAVVGRANIFLGADTAAFTNKINKAQRTLASNATRMNRALAKIDRGFKRVGRAVAAFAKRIFSLRGGLAAVAGIAGLGLLAKRSLDTADKIAKTADAIGISTDALQKYRFALEISGVAMASTDKGLKKFTRNMGELARSSSETQTALKDLDPALLKNLRSLTSVDAQLALGFRALAGYTSQTKRAAVAQALFGRSGVDMTVGVKKGIDAFEELQDKARRLGIVIEEKLLRGAEDAVDQLTILGKVISANFTSAILEAAPKIAELAQRLSEAIPEIIQVTEEIIKATAAFLKWLGVLNISKAQRIGEEITELTLIINSLNEELQTPLGPVTEGPAFERLERLLDRRDALEARLRGLKNTSMLDGGAVPGTTPAPDTVDPVAFDKAARERLTASDALIDSIRGEETAARALLSTVAATIQTNQERYEAELEFLGKTATALEETGQLTAQNQALLDRGAAAALKRLEESNPALQEAKALLAGVATEEERLIVLEGKLNELVGKGALKRDQANKILARTKDRMAETLVGQNLLVRGMGAIDQALSGNMDTWQDWARVAINAIQRVLEAGFQTTSGSGIDFGGLFSSIFGSSGPSPQGGGPSGRFAHGGRPPVGQVSIVGERGPELFRPDVAGTILPNSALRDLDGGGRGGDTFNIDARGAARGVEKDIVRAIVQLRRDVPTISVGAVVDARRRNPGLFR
jgi:hypothetical protein